MVGRAGIDDIIVDEYVATDAAKREYVLSTTRPFQVASTDDSGIRKRLRSSSASLLSSCVLRLLRPPALVGAGVSSCTLSVLPRASHIQIGSAASSGFGWFLQRNCKRPAGRYGNRRRGAARDQAAMRQTPRMAKRRRAHRVHLGGRGASRRPTGCGSARGLATCFTKTGAPRSVSSAALRHRQPPCR